MGRSRVLADMASQDVSAAELDKLDGLNTTTAELNKLDGDVAATSTTLVDADRFIVNDNGSIVQVAGTDLKTYIGAVSSTDVDSTSLINAIIFG